MNDEIPINIYYPYMDMVPDRKLVAMVGRQSQFDTHIRNAVRAAGYMETAHPNPDVTLRITDANGELILVGSPVIFQAEANRTLHNHSTAYTLYCLNQ